MIDKDIDGAADRWAARLPDEDVSTVEPISRLWRVARLIERFHRETLRPLELEISDYQVLAHLWLLDEATESSPTELARILLQTPAGMTKTLDRLEARGIVRRVPSKRDRRSLSIHLTASGRRLAERACRKELAAQQDVLSSFDPKKLTRLDGLLRQLVDALRTD